MIIENAQSNPPLVFRDTINSYPIVLDDLFIEYIWRSSEINVPDAIIVMESESQELRQLCICKKGKMSTR